MQSRYQKNIDDILNEKVQENLLTKNIAVIGCGGQGGYTIEYLARLGVKSITFWDGDTFSESNLNRQIGCTEKTIGQNKAKVMESRIKEINSSLELYCNDWFLGEKETDLNDLLKVDCIFFAADCYYNVAIMRGLVKKALIQGIPVIEYPSNFLGGFVYINTHNDINHFDFGTVQLLTQYHSTDNNKLNSQTAYKCALIAAEAVNQMVLYFANSRFANIDSCLNIDIYHHRYSQYDKYCDF